MLMKVGAVVAAFPLAVGAGLASMDYVVVDVRDHGRRIVVPVPVALAEAAASMAPADAVKMEIDDPEATRHMAVAQDMLKALAEIPDATLVQVKGPDESVRVAKEGDHLRIEVDGDDEQVSVRVPLAMAQEVLHSVRGGRVRLTELVGALRRADGDLVQVKSADTQVRVYVW